MKQSKIHRFYRDAARRRGGFSLIELVVVVGVIITLISLVLAVSTLLIQQNEARQLESAFATMNVAVQEYELAVGRPLTYQDRFEQGDGRFDIPWIVDLGVGGLGPFYGASGAGNACNCSSTQDTHGWEKTIVRLLQLLERTDAAESAIAKLDPSLFRPLELQNGLPLPSNASLSTLEDPWGAAVAVVMPGRRFRDGVDESTFDRDADGTIRTLMENKLGVCRNGQLLFVSAGPDGDIGCLGCSGQGDSTRFEATLDNIYSYSPEKP